VAFIALPLLCQGAQGFPDRPVKLVVSSPAGGPPDIVARILSDRMGAALGQPVIVENRPGGAGGTVGARSVIAAEPDGHTLMMGSTSSLLIAPLIYKNAGYTAATFAPVAGLSETTEVLAVHPSVQAASVAELIKLAKSEPGALRYGSAGIGTLPHLEGELLKTRAQIDISHIPYRGGGPALTGLLGGEGHIFFSALTQMLPYVRDGRLVGLAVTSERRRAGALWRRQPDLHRSDGMARAAERQRCAGGGARADRPHPMGRAGLPSPRLSHPRQEAREHRHPGGHGQM